MSNVNMLMPGDVLVARVSMRSWESIDHRGEDGEYITKNNVAFVIASKTCGQKIHIITFCNHKVLKFACKLSAVIKNWYLVNRDINQNDAMII